MAGDFTGDGRTDLAVANGGDNTVSVLLGNGDGTFSAAGQFVTTPHATPLVADVNGDGTKDVLVVDGAGNILYRQGVPGQPGTFEPPVTVNPGNPSRDIAWVPNPGQVPVLASVDAHDNADLALLLRRRWLREGRLAGNGPSARADHRGRPERQRLDRPGRPQRRRRHALGLLRYRIRQKHLSSRLSRSSFPRNSCLP